MPSRRQVARVGLPLVALAAAGAILLAVGGPVWTTVAGMTLVGLAGVGAVSAAFYAVGVSEDRERSAEERARERASRRRAANTGRRLVPRPFTRRRDHGSE